MKVGKKKYIEFPLGILRIILPFLVIPYEKFFEVFILWFSPWNIKNSTFLWGKFFCCEFFFFFDCPRNPHFPQLQDAHCFFSILPIVIFIFFFTYFFFLHFLCFCQSNFVCVQSQGPCGITDHIKTYFINGTQFWCKCFRGLFLF